MAVHKGDDEKHKVDDKKWIKCNQCSRRFLELSQLDNHKLEHHNKDKEYTCDWCGKQYVVNFI